MLISQAWAQGAAPAQGDVMSQMFFMVAIVIIFFFLMIRPQMKRQKEHKAMIEALQKGDEVVTAGGVVGKVVKVDDNYIALQVAENVEITVQRPSVQVVLPKGTLKSL